jgi:DNA-binding MarR family transcriptional regulator
MEPKDCAASSVAPLTRWMDVLIRYVGSDRHDLTNRQMALLLLVYLDPGPHTVRGIAARLKVSKPVVTRILNTLSSYGWVRRQKDMRDLRNIFVERTEDGASFLDTFAGLIADETAHDRSAGRKG